MPYPIDRGGIPMEVISYIDAVIKCLQDKRRAIIMKRISNIQSAIIENRAEAKRLDREVDKLYDMR